MFLVSISSFEIMHSYFQTNWISSFGLELLPTNHFNWRLYLTRVPSKNVFRWVLSFPPCLDFLFCYHEFLSSKQIGWAWEHLWISTSSDLPLQFETLFDKFAIQECHNISHSLVLSYLSRLNFLSFVTMYFLLSSNSAWSKCLGVNENQFSLFARCSFYLFAEIYPKIEAPQCSAVEEGKWLDKGLDCSQRQEMSPIRASFSKCWSVRKLWIVNTEQLLTVAL